jgi:hypothetical protein
MVAVLKQVVMVFFAMIFCSILAWTYVPKNRSLENLRYLPLEEGAGGEAPRNQSAGEVNC